MSVGNVSTGAEEITADFQANKYAAFPNVEDARTHLDLSVLSDIREIGSGDDDHGKVQPCFALGERQDHSAGLNGFSFTPYFDSMLELDDFCKKHMPKIREIAKELEDGAAYPSNNWWK